MICTRDALPKTCPKNRVDSAIPHGCKHRRIQASIRGGSAVIATPPPSAKPRLDREGKKPCLEALFSPSTH